MDFYITHDLEGVVNDLDMVQQYELKVSKYIWYLGHLNESRPYKMPFYCCTITAKLTLGSSH